MYNFWRNKTKKTTFIIVVVLLIISIGFATLNTELKINGLTTIKSSTWDIHFENVQVKTGSVDATTPQIVDKTKVTYNISLEKPGDFYEFTVDIKNGGSINATIDQLNITQLTQEQLKFLDYSVKYIDSTPIQIGDNLSSNESRKVLVKVIFKKDISNTDMPSDKVDLQLKVELRYVQGDGTSSGNQQPSTEPTEEPENPSTEPEEQNPSVNESATYISDSLLLGYSWVSQSGSYLAKTLSSNSSRITVNDPLPVHAGDQIIVSQTKSYVFGYFFATYDETAEKYHFDRDYGWQTKLANEDVVITVPQDGVYLITNWKNSGSTALTETDLNNIKELITFVKNS